jgi:D-alanyl-D-alanine carboxypeptidase
MKQVLALVLLVELLTGCNAIPARPADTAPLLKNPGLDIAELDALLARHVKENDLVGLSVGVMQQGKVVLAKGYGFASLETRRPVTAETMFAIASVSKQFTCAAVMLLAEDGKLSLNDRVAKYDKKLTRADDLTLLELGQHVAGWPDYYPLDFVDQRIAAARPVDEVVRDYATRPLDFEPRTRWSYSNTGYLFMGRVVDITLLPDGTLRVVDRHYLSRISPLGQLEQVDLDLKASEAVGDGQREG